MTSSKKSSTELSALAMFYACWDVKLVSASSCFQSGKCPCNVFMANAVFRESNVFSESLEIECFLVVFVKTCVSEAFAFRLCRFTFLRCLSCAGMPWLFFARGLSMCEVCTEAVHCAAL